MTRWVRSGSSQKHKKMPGNATKWGEFDNQYVKKIPLKKKKNIETKTNCKQKSNSFSSKTAESLNEDFFDEDKHCFSFQTENSNKMSEQENDISDETHCKVTSSDVNNKDDNINFPVNKIKNLKIKKKLKQQNTFDVTYSDVVSKKHKKIKIGNDRRSWYVKDGDEHDDFAKNTNLPKELFSQQYDIKKKKQNKINVDSESLSIKDKTVGTSVPNIYQKVMSLPNHVPFDNSNESSNIEQNVEFTYSSGKINDPDKLFQDVDGFSKKQKVKKLGKLSSDSKHSPVNNETSVNNENSSFKKLKNKKEIYLKKLQKKREKLGLLLLPRNVECKLQKIKRRLTEKGFPPEMQKEIMRKARRKEELKYQRMFKPSKLCFNCREAGHVLADCPKKSESLKQETGICFKCGSYEHTSFKCPQKIQGFPFANCFICKEQGHISRDCPKNKHGIYPKGGRCNLCGNVNHLKRDCPTLKKKENEEENITLHILNEDASIDAEVVKKEETKKKPKIKGKIVKF